MTSPRENLISALEGEQPQTIPYTIYHGDFITDDPAWDVLFAHGLCPIGWAHTTQQTRSNVERVVEPETWYGYPAERVTLRTPVGEISRLSARGWVQEYYLKTQMDYRVMTYIVQHTQIEANVGGFVSTESLIGDRGITLIDVGRSPMQTILVDYAGLEAFSYHLTEGFPELFALQEALMDQFVRNCQLVAAGPGRYISMLENLTAETWGPRRFARYHMPVYERVLPILHAGGKRVYTHFDGQLACLAELVAQTEIDGIESLTQPPEGDMHYADARAVWPDKFVWANINVSLYELPARELCGAVQEMARNVAPDGRLSAFEISEDLSPHWRESMPVVLDALANLNL